MSAIDGFVIAPKPTAHFGITEADFAQIADDALHDEALASTPRPPAAADITALLAARS